MSPGAAGEGVPVATDGGDAKVLATARDHRMHGRFDACSALLQEILGRDPMHVGAMLEGALLSLDVGDYPVAERFLQACRLFDPRNADLLLLSGSSAFYQRDPERAIPYLRDAARLAPGSLDVRIALAQILYSAGFDADARGEMHTAFTLAAVPGSDEGMRRSLARIADGDWDAGWREFALHWETKFAAHFREARWWRGEPLGDEDLHVVAYGGLGDSIFFARFLPVAAARARQLHLCVPAPLQRLLSGVRGVASLTPAVDAIPHGAVVTSLWHLAWLLGGEPDRYAPEPYLVAPDDGPRLEPTRGLRVGIAWAGSARAGHNVDRSPPSLATLSPLLAVEGVTWLGLHPEPAAAAECAALGIGALPPVRDFADTAAVLRQLDLVITVDSSVSNLAPALGIPTWVFCTRIPEMRWPAGAARSPWFPWARPFRRRSLGDWEAVARAAAGDLRQRVATGADPDLPAYRRR
ncbi:MAG: tetratricopeptide repeat protein [Gemmatimonadaceae bacterium]|nr:tetratricopeptide repeat protein [Gemmatimonadaceae bacterium]